MGILHFYFGWPDGAVWSNLLASLICAGVVWWRLHVRMVAQHAEVLAQGARHHREHLGQSEAHHQAATEQAERHQQELLDRGAVQHVALKSHVSAASHLTLSAVQVPQQLLDDFKAGPEKKPGGAM